MKDRFTIETTHDGAETYLLDGDHEGETVAVFMRDTHAEDARHIAELLNAEQALRVEPVGFPP